MSYWSRDGLTPVEREVEALLRREREGARMIPWVHELLREWARFVLKEQQGLGYPGHTIEYRMMRDYGRRSRRQRPSMISRARTRIVIGADGKPKPETIMEMAPKPKPKQTQGYNNWDSAFLWPPQLQAVDARVVALPDPLRTVIRLRYLTPGSERAKAEAQRMSRSRYYELLEQAHVRLAGELKEALEEE